MGLAQLAVLGFVVLLTAIWSLTRKTAPSHAYLLGREPDRERWSRLYPNADPQILLAVLEAIRDAFLLREDDVWRLRAEDRLIDIYRAAYPSRDVPDTLEFVFLGDALRDRFCVPDAELTSGALQTVGDIIDASLRAHKRRPTSGCS